MITLSRQTIGRHAHGSLRLSGKSVCSPYFQMADLREEAPDRNTNNILVMLTAFYLGYSPTGTDGGVSFVLRDSNNIYNFSTTAPLTVVGTDTDVSVESRVSSAVASFLITNGLTAPDVEYFLFDPTPALPTLVSGVAKTGTFFVTGSPTVAGGSGVVRFYIDSNGDGTGTAPSEVYASSLQTVVVNGSNLFVPSVVSVDTNRKYIDVTMLRQNFTSTLLSLVNVLTGATLGSAPNGTTINCLVLVKK